MTKHMRGTLVSFFETLIPSMDQEAARLKNKNRTFLGYTIHELRMAWMKANCLSLNANDSEKDCCPSDSQVRHAADEALMHSRGYYKNASIWMTPNMFIQEGLRAEIHQLNEKVKELESKLRATSYLRSKAS